MDRVKNTFKQQLATKSRLRRTPEKLGGMVKAPKWLSRSKPDKEDEVKRCFLLELPTELLLQIISHLTEVPEACLALTCKSLFAISGPTLGSAFLRFQLDFPRIFHHYRDDESFDTARWKLLILLEDQRWRACPKCLKLHSRSAFTSRELRRRPTNRTCKLGSLAGIVDLCPCKKLTFRDKMGLVAFLRTYKESEAGLKGEPCCWHSCTQKYGSTEMKIDIFPELDEQDNLVVRTEYRLSAGRGQLARREHMTPRLGCPHRSADLWFSSVCQTTICQLHESSCPACRSISNCSCCGTKLRCPTDRSCREESPSRVIYFFRTQRCLGASTRIPDKIWAAQRVHPAANKLCPWTIRQHPPLRWPPSLGMHIISPALSNEPLSQLYYSINRI